MEKIELIWQKLSFIQMKILNGIACNLHSIRILIINSNSIEKNGVQIGAKGIENLHETMGFF